MAYQEAQKKVDEWIQLHKIGYWKPHEILARIMEEVGEFAKEVNHDFGPKKRKINDTSNVKDELGDILFSLCCYANAHGISLDECFQTAMDKCYTRDKDRFEKK